MEDARLAQKLRKEGSHVTSEAQVMTKPVAQAATVIDNKPAPHKVMQAPKAAATAPTSISMPAARVPATATESETTKPATDNRGFFVGLDPEGKPFFKILGRVTDTEYLALVKFTELQLNTTLDLYKPTSNLKIIKLLNELTKKVNGTETQK